MRDGSDLTWHCLNFLPEPQGHGSLRPTFGCLAHVRRDRLGGGGGGAHARTRGALGARLRPRAAAATIDGAAAC